MCFIKGQHIAKLDNMSNTCGHCNYQGDLKEKNILCLLKNSWHPSEFSCESWVDYSYNLNKEDRVKLANQARTSLDSKESTAKQKKFQIWILVLGIILGIVGTILTRWLLKKLGLS
jgi:hypothetical protein